MMTKRDSIELGKKEYINKINKMKNKLVMKLTENKEREIYCAVDKSDSSWTNSDSNEGLNFFNFLDMGKKNLANFIAFCGCIGRKGTFIFNSLENFAFFYKFH